MARGLYKFWLDYSKDDELLLSEIVDELKRKRIFARVIREGIAIVYDLMQGKLDTLLRFYPWIADVLKQNQSTEVDELKQQIEELKRIVIEQGGRNIPGSDLWMVPPAPKPGRALPPKPINDTPTAVSTINSSQAMLDDFLNM